MSRKRLVTCSSARKLQDNRIKHAALEYYFDSVDDQDEDFEVACKLINSVSPGIVAEEIERLAQYVDAETLWACLPDSAGSNGFKAANGYPLSEFIDDNDLNMYY